MGQQKNKWVFTELVKNPNNIEQLISYAIYKGFKDEKARNLRKEKKTDEQINAELVKYHDHCLSSQKQLDVFRDKAKAIVDGYVTAANSSLQLRFDAALATFEDEKKKDIAKLEKKVADAERTALKALMAGADKYSKQVKKPVGIVENFTFYSLAILKFMFSGVPKLFATAFSIGLLFTLWGFINGDAITGLRGGLYKMVDIAVPGKKITQDQIEAGTVSPNQEDEADNKKPHKGGA
jgi:hypothetical protein